jgi:hypothetical protein
MAAARHYSPCETATVRISFHRLSGGWQLACRTVPPAASAGVTNPTSRFTVGRFPPRNRYIQQSTSMPPLELRTFSTEHESFSNRALQAIASKIRALQNG